MSNMVLRTFCLLVITLLLCYLFPFFHVRAGFNLSLPHQHPFPQDIVQEFHRRVNHSLYRRQTLETQEKDQFTCVTGNPIDDCWRCDPNWENNRQHLADCAIGFGYKALGGKGGPTYIVTDPSDPDPKRPKPGTLRDAVNQLGPVWIIFSRDMVIKLKSPLRVTSFKTIDGRGVHVEITGGGCISIEHVTNVIVHNINIHHCYPANSDGDGLHVFGSSNVWIDHCVISNCADGLIDCTVGSTAITISNNYFHHHDKVMLLGHSDDYTPDRGMQVTVAFNRFGENLVQRMPRCRFGYFHVVNNDYTSWGQYAIGGSSAPTINSQGNRFIAPISPNNKEVTKRMVTNGEEWVSWNWRTEGDLMVNGAFFVPSGDGMNPQYTLASSLEPKSATFIDQLTLNAGLLVRTRGTGQGIANNPSSGTGGVSIGGGIVPGGGGSVPGGFDSGGYGSTNGNPSRSSNGGQGGYSGDGGWIFSSAPPTLLCHQTWIILFGLIILTFYFHIN